MAVQLIIPTMQYAEEIARMKAEFQEAGEKINGDGGLERTESIAEWIDLIKNNARPATVQEDRVPSSTFLVMDEEELVGIVNIRHYLTDYLNDYMGHIGYSIRHAARGRGLCVPLLREALKMLKIFGETRCLMAANHDNVASIKCILKNGGVYEDTRIEPDLGDITKRYWIDLTKIPLEAELVEKIQDPRSPAVTEEAVPAGDSEEEELGTEGTTHKEINEDTK